MLSTKKFTFVSLTRLVLFRVDANRLQRIEDGVINVADGFQWILIGLEKITIIVGPDNRFTHVSRVVSAMQEVRRLDTISTRSVLPSLPHQYLLVRKQISL